MQSGEKLIANNKRARHDYFLETPIETGIVLYGTEVKSLRAGKASLQESYVDLKNGEAWLKGLHISPYEQGNIYNVEPLRDRKLLLHKKELRKLQQATQREGYTIVPLRVVLRHGLIKIDIALAKGKKLHDKRETLKKKEDQRWMDKAMRKRI